jgi:hypothetical protein
MWYALMPLMAYKSFGSCEMLVVKSFQKWKVGNAKPTLYPEAMAIDLVSLPNDLLKP